MRYLSLCSGIEAASQAWMPLGWEPAAFAEIEPFPSAVLKHHYPEVPNLGDMTKFKEWPDLGPIDLVCGGTPCQSFSNAGLREGLNDPRGNLTLTFLAIVGKYQPKWIVWENVPGVISDATGALFQFLDGLEELGYVVDIDVLDAQYFNLAQRRKRVFVCAQSAADMMNQKTTSSGLTICQCLAEVSLLTLAALSDRSALDLKTCSFDAGKPRHSLKRRMKLFGLQDAQAVSILLENLAAIQPLSEQERYALGLGPGKQGMAANSKSSETTKLPKSEGMGKESTDEFQSIDLSLSKALEDLLRVASECITSTAKSETTESKIFSCAQAILCIAERITPSLLSCPSYWSAALSVSTALKEFTNYARSANSDLFTEVEWIQPWTDFIRQAERADELINSAGAGENFGRLLSLPESLRGDPAPRRETRARVTGCLSPGAHPGGFNGQDAYNDMLAYGGNNTSGPREVASALSAHPGACGRMDFETETFVAHTLRADGFDGSEDVTGRGTPLVPCLPFDTTQITSASNYSNPKAGDPCHPLAAGAHAPAVAFGWQNASAQSMSVDTISPTLDKSELPALQTGAAVRRLTPTECEALMGFPPGYTRIPSWNGWRKMGADETPDGCIEQGLEVKQNKKTGAWRVKDVDGPRYRALGNSWACNVARWVGQRIQMVEAIHAEAKGQAK